MNLGEPESRLYNKQNNDPPKMSMSLLPEPVSMFPYTGEKKKKKKDFTNVIKLPILSWRDYPGSPKGIQCNHKRP